MPVKKPAHHFEKRGSHVTYKTLLLIPASANQEVLGTNIRNSIWTC